MNQLEYSIVTFRCDHNPKIRFLRSAQNADTIVSSSDCEILERSRTQNIYHNEVYNMMLISFEIWILYMYSDTVKTRNEFSSAPQARKNIFKIIFLSKTSFLTRFRSKKS